MVPLVSNVLASAITDPNDIRRRLVEQVTGTVRWRELITYMAGQGVTKFYEIGAGKVLTGLVKRIAEGATACRWAIPTMSPRPRPGLKSAHSSESLAKRTASP